MLESEIGDSGTRVSFSARQRSLGRELGAVKRLVPEARGEQAARLRRPQPLGPERAATDG